jgi:SAM-dependent methyltransferase
MFGLAAAAVEHCRYLEIGCGDGIHLIASAIGLPDATFVGVDLSTVAIERGNRMIAELKLPNVSLYAADLTAWTPPGGGFDYVIAHGLYSWVPPPVRDALLSLMSRSLRPTGVGYVSYNAYPGCYIRRMVWEILRYHTADIAESARKIDQARELVKFLAAGQPAERAVVPALFAHELDHLLNDHDPRVLYHDDLSSVNEPVYFHQFAAHALKFGLRYVAEAEPNAMEARAFPPQVAGVLNGLAARDPLLKEQYLDFLRLRRFRQTLLSIDGQTPRTEPDAAAVPALAVSGKPKAESVDLAAGVAVTFTAERGASARTDLPIAKAALVELASCWPKRIPFPDLVSRAVARLGRESTAEDNNRLAQFIATVWMAELVLLHGDLPRYADTVSERPIASPLARLQVRTGPFASTLLHTSMRFDDAPSRAMIQLLDGTRTRDEIASELAATFPPDQRPDPATLRAGLDRNLERLAKGGLLVG